MRGADQTASAAKTDRNKVSGVNDSQTIKAKKICANKSNPKRFPPPPEKRRPDGSIHSKTDLFCEASKVKGYS